MEFFKLLYVSYYLTFFSCQVYLIYTWRVFRIKKTKVYIFIFKHKRKLKKKKLIFRENPQHFTFVRAYPHPLFVLKVLCCFSSSSLRLPATPTPAVHPTLAANSTVSKQLNLALPSPSRFDAQLQQATTPTSMSSSSMPWPPWKPFFSISSLIRPLLLVWNFFQFSFFNPNLFVFSFKRS